MRIGEAGQESDGSWEGILPPKSCNDRQRRLLTRRSVSLENGAYLMTPWPANGSDRGIGVRGTNLAPH
jgi:hypothetical protein